MKLNAEHMKSAIEAIMDDEGVSPEEIANAAGLNRTAIYKILAGDTQAVRRSTIRQIADGMNYKFIIDGDRVTFVKSPPVDESLTEMERELVDLYRELATDDKTEMLQIVRSMCGVLRKRRPGVK